MANPLIATFERLTERPSSAIVRVSQTWPQNRCNGSELEGHPRQRVAFVVMAKNRRTIFGRQAASLKYEPRRLRFRLRPPPLHSTVTLSASYWVGLRRSLGGRRCSKRAAGGGLLRGWVARARGVVSVGFWPGGGCGLARLCRVAGPSTAVRVGTRTFAQDDTVWGCGVCGWRGLVCVAPSALGS